MTTKYVETGAALGGGSTTQHIVVDLSAGQLNTLHSVPVLEVLPGGSGTMRVTVDYEVVTLA